MLRQTRPPETKDQVEPNTRLVQSKKKDSRFLIDTLRDSAVVVRRGAFKTTDLAGNILFLAGEGSLYGHQFQYLKPTPPLAARPLMPEIELCVRPWADFERYVQERPALFRYVVSDMASNAFSARMAFHWTKRSLRDRALLILDLLRNRFGVRYGQFKMINLPLTKIDIASMMSTVQESAVRVLSELRASGLISQNGKRIIILDNDRLDQMLKEIHDSMRDEEPVAAVATESPTWTGTAR